jgi:hypothetical protein
MSDGMKAIGSNSRDLIPVQLLRRCHVVRCAAPMQAVIPAHAGIQYSRALMFNRKGSGILGRPVKSRAMTAWV